MEQQAKAILYTRIQETPEGTPGLILRSAPLPFEIGTWMEVIIFDDHILITPKAPTFLNDQTQ